jgi:hypothetical protein
MDLSTGMSMGMGFGLDPSDALLASATYQNLKSTSENVSEKATEKATENTRQFPVGEFQTKRPPNKNIKYQGKTYKSDDVYDNPEKFI